jgi:hypothetical protein
MSDGLTTGDLERIRRSLAMSPSITKAVADDLLAEIHRLRGQLGTVSAELDRAEAAVRKARKAAAP